MKIDQKGNVQLVIILIIIVVGLVLSVYLVQRRTNIFPKAAAPTPTYTNTNQTTQQSSIKNDSDLLGAASDLDNTDLNTTDSELNQNNSDF